MVTMINPPANLSNYTLGQILDPNYSLGINLILNQGITNDVLTALEEKCKMNAAMVQNSDELHIKIVGTHRSFTKIFNITLYNFTDSAGNIYYSNKDVIVLQPEYNYVNHIIGLNNFKNVSHYACLVKESEGIVPEGIEEQAVNPKELSYFTPLQVASLYKYPTGYNGTGQTIGIIELGGGYRVGDLNYYFRYLGLNPMPTVVSVLVNGGTNNPSDQNDSVEVVLDIEVSGAIANASTIVVYFAPNTDTGFYDAISAAINDTRYKPSIISISWGAPENEWSTSTMNSFNTLFASAVSKGINVFVASGDSGSGDGESGLHVDFPSSSPNVIACGATTLNSNGSTIQSETVWHDEYGASGGGISSLFAKPSYQNNIGINTTKRCTPDVVSNGDPATGYLIYMNGGWWTVGGSSCSAPLMGGLTGRLNQHKGTSIGFMNIKLYQNKPCVAITEGNNGAYTASANYNCASGEGRLNGTLVLTEL